ncbi:MAG: aminotransferase class III-fold pyridoxal phosphate-dependent enzyme, partial [Pseudomonadota bacterium]
YERRRIVDHVRRVAPRFEAHLKRLGEHPLVGEARCSGLMGGLELSPDPGSATTFATPGKVGPRLAQELLPHGVILRAIGDTLAFCPPMIISEEEIDALFEPIETALDATMHWAKAEGHLG